MKGFNPVTLFARAVLLLLCTLVQSASCTNYDGFTMVTTIADRVEPTMHTSNLDVLQKVVPAFASTKRHVLVIVLCTEVNLVALVHGFNVFK